MSKELSKAYQAKEVEKKWSDLWLEKGYFKAEATSQKPSFCMMIPPPNVTGSLHMGHALNNTLQDILARYRRMRGYNVLWMPGTDHAGIATQNVVEKALAKEGSKRQDLGREMFIKKVWEWKEKHGSHIIHQLKRLGASCDWSRERFTMDEGLSKSVRTVFIQLHKKGLIHRSLYLINWCTRCRTALSDIEVEHQDQSGYLWHIKYPIVGATGRSPLQHVIVATTRPETMLGDTAVAVHPSDERYKDLVGKKVTLPLVGRELIVIADHRVDKEFGTGVVKITPAHDFNDYAMGKDHKLEEINILTEDGKINENGIHFQGQGLPECRKQIVQELEEKGFLEKIEKHKSAVGQCYRCRQTVEPFLSLQWFVKVKPLAEKALKVVQDGKTKFFPTRWTKTYEIWMEEIKDWCISRQIWWGHRIPAWYCVGDADKHCTLDCKEPIVADKAPASCSFCGSKNFRQETDVLDTWFSSALWPFSTLGWPDKTPELKTFYPTSVLITGFDIIFFWVARMMMMGLEFMGDVPFKDVYIHALVRDAEGKKMSKSKGNVIDPLTIMDKFGTDAFRFTLAVLASPGRDVKLSEQVIEGYRNFCNKIWNASRFLLSQSKGVPGPINKKDLTLYDQWILTEWNLTLKGVIDSLDGYRYDEAAKGMYRFFWHSFCDWYVEFSKNRPNPSVLYFVLDESLRALHPFMPFISEEISSHLRVDSKQESMTLAPYPKVQDWGFGEETRFVERLQSLVTAIRTVRGENGISNAAQLEPVLHIEDKAEREWFKKQTDVISKLTKSQEFKFVDKKLASKKMAHYALGGMDVYVPLEGLVDFEEEKKRLEKEIQKLKSLHVRLEKKLGDKGFLNHAEPSLVASEKEKMKVNKEKMARLNETYQNI